MRLFIDDPRQPDDVTVADLRDLAGDLVRSGRPDRVEVAATKSTATDVVTRMDADSEALLRRGIAAARPDDAVLGEEEGASSGTSGITWVIDPVDGTVNYLYGIASYAVSVAAVVGPPDPLEWTVLAGAVHSVVDGRTWTAGLGAGATVDGRPVRVNAERDLGQCLVGTGFGYDADRLRACWSTCGPGSGTSAASARRRSTCASSPRASSTSTTSAASTPGTWLRAPSWRTRREPASRACGAAPRTAR